MMHVCARGLGARPLLLLLLLLLLPGSWSFVEVGGCASRANRYALHVAAARMTEGER